MRVSLLLAVIAAFAIAPEATAQRPGAQRTDGAKDGSGAVINAWYLLKLGDRTETVRAQTIEVRTARGRTAVLADGRRLQSRGEVNLLLAGTCLSRPSASEMRRQQEAGPWLVRQRLRDQAQSDTSTSTTISTEISDDGKTSTTTTTTSTTDSSGTTTTTTTTSQPADPTGECPTSR